MASKSLTVTDVPSGPPRHVQAPSLLRIPPSDLQPLCHPLEKQVTEEVNGYFLKHWNFTTEKSRKKFVNAGFSTVTCWYFPMALDDRIHFACRLLTILFLIDGMAHHKTGEKKPMSSC